MRRDGSLLFMGHDPVGIGEMWRADARLIARARGVVMLLTHCERRFSGNDAMLDTYRRFLEFIAGTDTFAWSTPAGALASRPMASVV